MLQRCTFETIEKSIFIPLGLQASKEPGTHIREPFVVEVYRILGRQNDPQPEGAGLLEQGHHRAFARWLGRRREVSVDFIHVENGAKCTRTVLAAHPRDELIEQDRHEEHSLGIVQVGDRDDRYLGRTARRIEQCLDVQGLALHPACKGWRGHQIIQRHGELGSLIDGKKRIDIHHPYLFDRWGLDESDQVFHR